jgi:ribosomal protein S1
MTRKTSRLKLPTVTPASPPWPCGHAPASTFGAFVDIGIKETALVHVSEMSDAFVKDPMDVLKVGDTREFRVVSLDPVRRRIGLSLKSPRAGSVPGAQRTWWPPPQVSDTAYNPFAELLKKKRK